MHDADAFIKRCLQLVSEEELRLAMAKHLARSGEIVVSRETARAIERVELLQYNVPLKDLEDILYAVYAGPSGDYLRAKVCA
ncbi:hypothetical protein E3H11_31145 [Bradyrhizobium brasilense]|uniref:hypothetical protein n=1 Tax=Bradyrhizobium brasilense TaxID=1419277 RepID=UPI0014568CF4|nr:hypothetical protein [Bradyrhizobium brasilense]NLS73285.1 hypothetical protein [Bradyrhizobium brasilense]